MKVSELFEASAPNMKKVEQELKAHAKSKIDYEKEFGPMSAPDLHSHEVKRKQLLKKLNAERSKANVSEAIAAPVKRFKKGQIVKVKKTGEKVEVMSQSDLGLVFTKSKDAVLIPADKKLKVVPGKGYKEYMPTELEESWKGIAAAGALGVASVAGIVASPKAVIDGQTYDLAITSAPADAKVGLAMVNGKKTKVKYWVAAGPKNNKKFNVYKKVED